MQIEKYEIDFKDVIEGLIDGVPCFRIGNIQPTPEHSFPFIFITDGEIIMKLKFDSEVDVNHFNELVQQLEYRCPKEEIIKKKPKVKKQAVVKDISNHDTNEADR